MAEDIGDDKFHNVPQTATVRGVVTGFLRRDLFTVRIDDGREITAVMPERLLSEAAKAPMGFSFVYLSAKVLLRPPPKLPVIIEASMSGLCGIGAEAPQSPFP